MSALVSVIVPAYNHQNYVQETIQSIVDQTFQAIELIVINDGSKDNTHQKIEEIRELCEQRFVSFKYINKENEGVVKTLNMGVKLAESPYVYIIASDDLAEQDAVEILYEFLSEHSEYGLVTGGNLLIDENSKQCFWDKYRNIVYEKGQAVYVSMDDFLKKSRPNLDFSSNGFGTYRELLIGNHIPNGYLMDRETILSFGGYSEKGVLEDLYVMLQISKLKKLKFIDKPLFHYRWHSENSIKNEIKVGQMQHLTIINEKQYCLKNGYFVLWLKRAYLPSIKYQFGKIKNILRIGKS